jgi:pimeloyl-ACP methyl ester carboxylesterase
MQTRTVERMARMARQEERVTTGEGREERGLGRQRKAPKLIAGALLLILLALLLALGWLSLTVDLEIVALRNVLHYNLVKRLGGPNVRAGEPPGSVSGRVLNAEGEPVSGAVMLVASPLGHTYTAASGPDGGYRIGDVPSGRYLPVAGKRGYDDAFNQTCLAGLCYRHSVTVHSDAESRYADLTLTPTSPPEIVVDASLHVSPSLRVEVGAPFPARSLRTDFSFERAGLVVNDCHLYEPLDGEGPYPTMLLVLPGPVRNWEYVPVPFEAEGFSVLACYPLRGFDIDGDVADLMTTMEYVRQGRIPSRADTERLALVGASFTSIHAYRLLGLTDEVDVVLILGGMGDGFAFRHDVETGAVHTRPPFGEVLMALGYPNSSPELYFKYSSLYHLDGLPPVCLLHGVDDELVPFSQGVQLAEELARREHPYEFYSYDGLSHYFSTEADNETTQQMWRDSLDCLRRWLSDE